MDSNLTKFDTILIASRRVRQLSLGSPVAIIIGKHKPTVVALKELKSDSIDAMTIYDDILSSKESQEVRKRLSFTSHNIKNRNRYDSSALKNLFNTDIDELFESLIADHNQLDADESLGEVGSCFELDEISDLVVDDSYEGISGCGDVSVKGDDLTAECFANIPRAEREDVYKSEDFGIFAKKGQAIRSENGEIAKIGRDLSSDVVGGRDYDRLPGEGDSDYLNSGDGIEDTKRPDIAAKSARTSAAQRKRQPQLVEFSYDDE